MPTGYRPTASTSALLLSPCQRWAWEGARHYRDEFADTSKRDLGTEFHEAMDRHARDLPIGEVSDGCQELLPKAVEYWKKLRNECRLMTSELAVGLDLVSGEAITASLPAAREYPLDGRFWGSIDICGELLDGSAFVADWKTGQGIGSHQQLMTLMLAFRAAALKGPWKLQLITLYVDPDGVYPVRKTVTEAELEAHRQTLLVSMSAVGVDREPHPGAHCTQLYCPHLGYCPAIGEGMVNMAEANKNEDGLVQDITSDQHAGQVMAMVAASKRQGNYLTEKVKRYLVNGGKAVDGDYEWKQTERGYRWVKR
jgi:hypothetical protein